jgi:hypothetical protein
MEEDDHRNGPLPQVDHGTVGLIGKWNGAISTEVIEQRTGC